MVFTGDLTLFGLAGEENASLVKAGWHLLWELGARRVYPAHGPVRMMVAMPVE